MLSPPDMILPPSAMTLSRVNILTPVPSPTCSFMSVSLPLVMMVALFPRRDSIEVKVTEPGLSAVRCITTD